MSDFCEGYQCGKYFVQSNEIVRDESGTIVGRLEELKSLRLAADRANQLEEALQPSREYAKQWRTIADKRTNKIIELHGVIRELKAENKKLDKGLTDVCNLIDCSSGVYGLHLNGDLASWEELEHDWLDNFEIAIGVHDNSEALNPKPIEDK